ENAHEMLPLSAGTVYLGYTGRVKYNTWSKYVEPECCCVLPVNIEIELLPIVMTTRLSRVVLQMHEQPDRVFNALYGNKPDERNLEPFLAAVQTAVASTLLDWGKECGIEKERECDIKRTAYGPHMPVIIELNAKSSDPQLEALRKEIIRQVATIHTRHFGKFLGAPYEDGGADISNCPQHILKAAPLDIPYPPELSRPNEGFLSERWSARSFSGDCGPWALEDTFWSDGFPLLQDAYCSKLYVRKCNLWIQRYTGLGAAATVGFITKFAGNPSLSIPSDMESITLRRLPKPEEMFAYGSPIVLGRDSWCGFLQRTVKGSGDGYSLCDQVPVPPDDACPFILTTACTSEKLDEKFKWSNVNHSWRGR
ncbi:MAG: hypothetical protein KDB07_08850, partial [Planctomycetes bacterium]|nr:hypothetical protein [Planctomycetota bacterium]